MERGEQKIRRGGAACGIQEGRARYRRCVRGVVYMARRRKVVYEAVGRRVVVVMRAAGKEQLLLLMRQGNKETFGA